MRNEKLANGIAELIYRNGSVAVVAALSEFFSNENNFGWHENREAFQQQAKLFKTTAKKLEKITGVTILETYGKEL